MAHRSDFPAKNGRRAARTVVILASLLFMSLGVTALSQFTSRPLPKEEFPNNPVHLSLVTIGLLVLGSGSALVHVANGARLAWSFGLLLNSLAIASTGIISFQGMAALVWMPARGCFGGVANAAVFLFVVLAPLFVAVAATVTTFCLCRVRPEPEEVVPGWAKLLRISVAPPIAAAVGVIGLCFQQWTPAQKVAQPWTIEFSTASVQELSEALGSDDVLLRERAVEELRQRGPRAKDAVPALAKALQDDEAVCYAAADALAKIGPGAAPAIPSLVAVIEHDPGEIRNEAEGGERPSTLSALSGRALVAIGPASVPPLIKLLSHPNRFSRMTAARSLGAIGPDAREAVPMLNEALSDSNDTVRRSARAALDGIRAQGHPDPNEADEADNKVHEIPIGEWTELAPYPGDPRHRPRGTVCFSFQDGYLWLVKDSAFSRDLRSEGDRQIESVVGSKFRYEHILGTKQVRMVNLMPKSPPPNRAARPE